MLLRSIASRLITTTTATTTSSFLSILQKNHSNPNLELTLSQSPLPLSPSTIQSVLDSIPSLPVPALRFFVWAGLHRSHRHSAFAYAAASHSLRLRSHPETLLLLLDSYRRNSVPVSLRTFKVILNLCFHSNLVGPALSLFNQMPSFGCHPDTPFFNTVLRLLAHNLETHHASIALKLFDEMLASGRSPDIVTYVLVIKALCAANRVSEACNIVSQMRANGCSPNKVVLSALFDRACAVGEFDKAMEILGEMEHAGDPACSPNVVTYTCLMKWLCENGKLEDAMGVLDRMRSHDCQPNRVTVRTLLAGFCSQGQLDNAYELVDRMVGEGSISSEQCHSLLIMCLLSIDDSIAAERVMRMMLERGLRPDAPSSNSLVRELCSKSQFIEAYQLFSELEENGVLCFSSDIYCKLLVGFCKHGYKDEALVMVRRVVENGVQVDVACADAVVELLRSIGEDHLVSKVLNLTEVSPKLAGDLDVQEHHLHV
ncbi:putative tetratricopeptide-like helical domain superfamily [Dioscorea sansibarensis]